ncbi:MAG: hypothetical protein ACRC5T_11045 [Cetobacterium sp.]
MNLIEQIEKERKKRHINKREFATLLGYSPQHYYNLVGGFAKVGVAALTRILKNAQRL